MAEEKKKAAEVTAAAEVAEPADDGREDIFIPRGPKNDDPNLFVSVNGKNYLLPRGQRWQRRFTARGRRRRSAHATRRSSQTVSR